MNSMFFRGKNRVVAALTIACLGVVQIAPALSAEFTAQIGHLESDQQSRHVFLEKVGALVAERTDGAVEFKIFPQGQLGGQREMTEGVQLGIIQGTVAPAAFLGGFNPVVSVMDIPFLLPEDEDAAQELREGPFGKALMDSFTARGVMAVALWPNGRKNFTSNKPLDELASFEGQKFRVMDSKILIEQFNALGAAAIALPFGELYTSLQTGVVDGQENPLDTIQRMKFFEVQKYLVVSGHGAMEDIILFNPEWWNSLPQNYRDVIVGAFSEVVPELRAHKAEAIAVARSVIEESDINIRDLSLEEKSALREIMYPRSRDAFLERAGNEGQALIDLYQSEYANLTD